MQTDDGVDNEHGVLDCVCGATFNYTGWTAPETIGWFNLHDVRPGHGIGVTVTKDCSCGRGDHPQGKCAPVGFWL